MVRARTRCLLLILSVSAGFGLTQQYVTRNTYLISVGVLAFHLWGVGVCPKSENVEEVAGQIYFRERAATGSAGGVAAMLIGSGMM